MIGRLLMLAGFGWAALGIINLTSLADVQTTGLINELAAFGLRYNMLYHILPGLAVGGFGYHMNRQADAAESKDRTR